MSNYKSCQVIGIETTEKTPIYKQTQDVRGGRLPLKFQYSDNETFLNNIHLINSGKAATNSEAKYKFMHLYIISDDEIKAGDWYMVFTVVGHPRIYQCQRVEERRIYYGDITSDDPLQCKKIIATTDKQLFIKKEGKNYMGSYMSFSLGENLPDIPIDFIEYYLEEYNKKNIIKELLVENTVEEGTTIKVKPIKQTFTREEVRGILIKFHDQFPDRHEIDSWIFKNV